MITADGQITVPEHQLDGSRLEEGMTVQVRANEHGLFIVDATRQDGILGYDWLVDESIPTREVSAQITDDRQITVPQPLLEFCGLAGEMEIQITATGYGLCIRKMPDSDDPLDLACGILGPMGFDRDAYMRMVRGHDFSD